MAFKTNVLCFVVLVISVYQSDAEMTKEEVKEAAMEIKKECFSKHPNVDKAELENMKKGNWDLGHESKCFIKCVQSSIGIITPDAKIDYDTIKKQITMLPKDWQEPMTKSADHCKDVVDASVTDECEAAYVYAKCIYDFDPKMFIHD